MLSASHNSEHYDCTPFVGRNSHLDLFKEIYWRETAPLIQQLNNGEKISSFDGISREDALEYIDQVRAPLEEFYLRGHKLSESDLSYLQLMQDLTDKILLDIASPQEFPTEVKSAISRAKYLIGKYGCQD